MTAAEASWLQYLLGPQALVVGLLLLVVAFYKEWVVPGVTHRRVREERDRALARVDRALHVSGRAVDIADVPAKK